jgi:hypothetical protein
MFALALAHALWFCSGASVQTETSGTAVGLNYSVANAFFENTSFEISPTTFSYSTSSWLGSSKFRVSVSKRRLSVNGKDCGPITAGDQLIVSIDHDVKVNGRQVR